MTGTVHVQCFEFWGNVRVNLVALVDNCGSSNYTSSLVSAISRSLLKLDQARGGWAGTHNTLKKLTRINIEASARRRESAGSATLIIEQQSARGRHTNRHRVPIRLPPGNPLAPKTAERSHPLGSPASRVTFSFLSFLGTVSYRIRILMYLDVSCMYLDCILMCPVHIHQDTSRYIKIHLYLVVSGTLAVSYQGECILLLRYI
jgi:hypothetical protein